MNARLQTVGGSLVCIASVLACWGCSPSNPESTQPAYAASTDQDGEPERDGGPPSTLTDEELSPPANDRLTIGPTAQGTDPDTFTSSDSMAANASRAGGDPFSQMKPPQSPGEVKPPFTLDGAEDQNPKTATLTELRADLTPKQLLDFLSAADSDMQLIVSGRSGIEDPQQARRTLLHIVKMKLEASRRLVSHQETNDRARGEGIRGELQSLSHLAALGDVKAAEELEKLAKTRMESDDPQIVNDSRLVLIGFAIESLQSGDEAAPDRIVSYIDQIANSSTPPDVASMMVMGEARKLLETYGHDQQARKVRDQIIELFADSQEPQIAEMAARLAGRVRFDGIDDLRKRVLNGETVETSQWITAGETLITESADLQTVQYLGGAALEFEGCGETELAAATYELLSSRFTEPESATSQEVAMANAAYQSRKKVIGQEFTPDLDSVDGAALDLKDYRGKVVLVPFWSMNFPQSLQMFPQLTAIVNQTPDRVAMVGVNLDPEGVPVADFMKNQQLGFRSFRAPNAMAGQIAERFGIVSMPFTAILADDGRVVEIDFTGKKLQTTVARLLEP